MKTYSCLCKLSALVLAIGLSGVAGSVRADSAEIAGTIEATVDGRRVQFPSVSSAFDVDLQGDLARVTVTQKFENPLGQPVNAQYLFPLNKSAAVFALTMKVGNERVKAVIQKKAEAQKTFVAAKKQGKAAVLLTQHRPNMFTQSIANLMPGMPIEVIMEYTQTVPKIDGSYELVVPLVVGPRFNPGSPKAAAGQNIGLVKKLVAMPSQGPVAGVHVPENIASNRVSLAVRLQSAVGFLSVTSATHDIDVRPVDGSTLEAALKPRTTIANRDFVLRYALGAEAEFSSGVLSHADERGGFFSVMIEPPQSFEDETVLPREMVFLLDCSGSMGGAPMAASKAFMRAALQALRPIDSFRIIRFSDHATEFSREPLPATAANIAAGLSYTATLRGSGGTVMRSGVEQALMVPQTKGLVRNVVFLTDGYIGNEFEILSLVERELGAARLFALGVGSGVNRYLLDELARSGRGFARYLDPTADTQKAAEALAQRLQTPLLTDLVIDWGDVQPTEVTPAVLPDLYAGDSVRVQGRYATPGQFPVQLSARSGGQRVNLPMTVTLKESVANASSDSADGEAIALVWARSAIRDAMHQLRVPQQLRMNESSDASITKRVTQLGLDFSLATRWTSFVAVSEQIVNPNPELAVDTSVPNAKVAGVDQKAYSAVNSTAAPHGGYGAPEPATWLGLALLSLMLLLWFGAIRPDSLFADMAHDRTVS